MGSAICGIKDKGHVIGPELTNRGWESYSENPGILFKDSLTDNDEVKILELSIKCTNLATDNRFQLLNPVAYVYIKEGEDFIKKAETEVVISTLNPVFKTSIKTAYSLKRDFMIKIEIYDESPTKKPARSLLGSNIFSLHELASRDEYITKDIMIQSKRNGYVLVAIKELKNLYSMIKMQWEFSPSNNLRSYLFLRISRQFQSSSLPVYQSETRQAPYNWDNCEISMNRLCGGSESSPLTAEIINFDSGLSVVGTCNFTLSLINTNPNLKLEMLNAGTLAGIISLTTFKLASPNSFLDYIHSNIEIFPFYAIDFSEKTGHSAIINENPYLNTIKSFQNVLQHYNQDPSFLIFGTGGAFKTIPTPSYYFSLTGNIFLPEVPTLPIVENYYKSTLENISPAPKTIFSELIENTMRYIKFESESHKYYVLVIISAGDPGDYEEILDKFTEVADLPLSIIVIKIGNELIIKKNLQRIEQSGNRRFFECFDVEDIENALEAIEKHMMGFAGAKGIKAEKKPEKGKTSRSNSLKQSPEKFRQKNNYFIRCKADYIEFLTKMGYEKEKIDEVNQIGIPFMIMDANPKTNLPIRNRTKTLIKQKSVRSPDLLCWNCNKNVIKLEESACGCKSYCENCVKNNSCPNCDNKVKLS